MRLTENHAPLSLDTASADDAAIQPAVALTHKKAEAAAEKFEAFFIADMLHRMRRSAREFGDHEDAQHSRANEDMLDIADSMVADKLAGQHAFGVADLILRQILPNEPVAEPQAAGFNLSPSTVALKK